ncbi:hypothetical protein CPB85DRAFT_297565 [Mucidula mucida]|nr:hypothetical protein CPB85DRAFT_297565 [Mucidula mucida]
MFSHLKMQLNVLTHENKCDPMSIVDDLASGKTRVGRYARDLRVILVSKRLNNQELKDSSDYFKHAQQNLIAAISSLSNVTTASLTFDVDFKYFRQLPMQHVFVQNIFRGIKSLQILGNVSIVIGSESVPSLRTMEYLHDIQNLHFFGVRQAVRVVEGTLSKIIAASPNLARLELGTIAQVPDQYHRNSNSSATGYRLERLFQRLPRGESRPIRHIEIRMWKIAQSVWLYPSLRLLDTLIIDRCNVTPGFWDGLREHAIFISTLTMSVEENIAPLRYLETNTALKRLTLLTEFNWTALAVVDDLAKYFWKEVISKRASKLKELHLRPQAHGKWSFCEFSREYVMECKKLQALSICVATQLEPNNDTISLLDTAKRLGRLRKLELYQARTSERQSIPTAVDQTIKEAVEKYTVKEIKGVVALQDLIIQLQGGDSYTLNQEGDGDAIVWKFQLQAV